MTVGEGLRALPVIFRITIRAGMEPRPYNQTG